MGELVDLRQDLARAQASGARDQVRAVTLRRRRLVQDLVAFARHDAADTGRSVTTAVQGELETTLEAAAATEEAGAALRRGRLVEALTHVGFGDLGSIAPGGRSRTGAERGSPQGAPASRRGGAGAAPHAGSKPVRADEAAAARATSVNAAATALADAERMVEEARRRRQEVVERRRTAAEELRRADRALAQAQAAMERARDGRRRAAQALREAEGGRPR